MDAQKSALVTQIASTQQSTRADATAAGPVVRTRLRPEVQALRAFAVLAVVANHLAPSGVRGGFVGVDVFFVISGFLITGHLVRERRESGRIDLPQFWARRARRLLPAAILVLLVSLAGCIAFLPLTQWDQVMRQMLGSAFYVQNWVLSAEASDYFTSKDSPSPVTHYWSLAVEEQFYVIWPILIIAGITSLGRVRFSEATRVGAVLGIVCGASFLVALATAGSTGAYFSTFTRAWEFGAGGLLALALGSRQLGTRAGAACGLIGWALLAGSVLLINESMHIPGWWALVPVVATVLVIAGGSGPGPHASFVKAYPVQLMGDISYGVYLWHWPPIVLLPYMLDHELDGANRVHILLGTFLLAWATKRLVEDPVRRHRALSNGPAWWTFAASGAVMLVVLGATTLAGSHVDQRRELAAMGLNELKKDGRCFGAPALAPDASCPAPFRLAVGGAELSDAGSPVRGGTTCMQDPEKSEVLTCSFGVPKKQASLMVVLTGDSHANHFIPALDRLAVDRRWHVEMYQRSSCPTTISDRIAPEWRITSGESCRAWAKEAVRAIQRRADVDLVVTSSISRQYHHYDRNQQKLETTTSSDYARTWELFIRSGKRVLVIGDVPQMGLGDIPACIAKAGTRNDPCSQHARVALRPDPMVAAYHEMPNHQHIRLFDPNQYICDEELCHSVVGGIPVFADLNHLTNTFTETLTPYLGQTIDALQAS